MAEHKVVYTEDEGVVCLSLGEPEEKTAVLTEKRINSLNAFLDKISVRGDDLRGLVILGPSAQGYCAGADIEAIKSVTDPQIGTELARLGQGVFKRIAALRCRTVAAIQGACVGGGCELVLACDYRIALASDKTRIGLPEIKLGILPGFGGSQRLPRLVGLPAALDIILQGRVVTAEKAKKIGLLDELVKCAGVSAEESRTLLEKRAIEIALGQNKPQRKALSLVNKMLTFTRLGRSIVKSRAGAAVRRETKGLYPAPLRALEITIEGLGGTLEEGLEKEAIALGELIVTDESKALVHLYFLTERANKLGRAAQDKVRDIKVAVIGGGVMGSGIAASFLAKGYRVALVELSSDARNKAQVHIEKSINRKRSINQAEKEKCLARIEYSDQLSIAKDSGLVVEAIVESLDIKKKVFKELASILATDAILASNTSSLSITAIAEAIAAPERVIGMHFFNPAEKMPLVEIVRGEKTSERTITYTAALTSALGKYPIVVEDVPGFLVNRVLSPYIAEAGSLLTEGVPIEKIDAAAVEFGMPMGPIRLLDEVGLDIAAKVQEMMVKGYGERMKAPDFLDKMLKDKRLGKKSGVGFYRYNEGDEVVDSEVYKILGVKPRPDRANGKEGIRRRLTLSLLNEAVRAFDERVAGAPGVEAGGQVDLATVMGIGFAPFRGGILRYAESLGAQSVFEQLEELAKEHGPRFVPCDAIVKRASLGLGFYEG